MRVNPQKRGKGSMDSKVFVLAIIAMWGVFSLVQSKHKAQAKKERQDNEEANSSLRREHENLKERVAVLERIVTDKRGRLAEEIDAL